MEIFWLFGDRDKVAITGEQLDTKWCPVRDSENPQDDTKRAAKALVSWWKKQSCKDNPADPLENNPELLCGSVEDQRDYKDSSTSRVKRGLQGVSRAAGGVNATVQTHWASSQIPLPWTCRLQSWPAPASITSTSAINPTHLGQGLDKVIQPTPSFFAKGFCVPRCHPWPSLICPLRRWLAWAPERVHEAWSEREITSPGLTTQTHRIHCNRPPALLTTSVRRFCDTFWILSMSTEGFLSLSFVWKQRTEGLSTFWTQISPRHSNLSRYSQAETATFQEVSVILLAYFLWPQPQRSPFCHLRACFIHGKPCETMTFSYTPAHSRGASGLQGTDMWP